MLEHINNILIDIDKLLEEDKYKLNNINIVKENLQSFKKVLEKNNDVSLIDLEKVKEVSNLIYDYNTINFFSTLTDHMSNELYAFEFLLQKELKKKDV